MSQNSDKPIDLAVLLFKYITLSQKSVMSRGASFYFCIYPKIMECLQPSNNEQYLKRISYESSGNDREKGYVGERIAWLNSFPPHLLDVYAGLDYLSKDYIEAIFSGPDIYKNTDGLHVQYDFNNKYVNVENGFRRTTGCPDQFQNTVHIFGPSYVYGFGSEDDHTIPSFLQIQLNTPEDDQPSAGSLRVLNYGIRGGSYEMSLKHISHAQICQNDIAILFDSWQNLPSTAQELITNDCNVSDRLVELCTAAGIPVIDFRPMFNRPHSHGEVFFDNGHMAYRGNLTIAKKLYNVCFRAGKLYTRNDIIITDFLLKNNLLGCANDKDSVLAYRGLQEYLEKLKDKAVPGNDIGCIVMNCNPFTLGHQNLINIASSQVDHLYIFVVQENRSYFLFEDRLLMVENGCSNLKNVTVLPGGEFIISTVTFPEYFEKETQKELTIDATMDIRVFGKFISKTLNISKRFVGEEPFCSITRQYNQQMMDILPGYGISLFITERSKVDDTPISASHVRKLIEERRFGKIANFVPRTTYDHLVTLGKIPRGHVQECTVEHLLQEVIQEKQETLQQLSELQKDTELPVGLSPSDIWLLKIELINLFHDTIGLSNYSTIVAFLQKNFNEVHYLAVNPDVAAAIADGKINSGLQHWMTWGFKERRNISLLPMP